jgi:predicted Zn-dependent protease
MTDALWPLVKADDEIEGVFAHEIAHVDRLHSLQSLYQAAMIPAAIAVVTGDVSQISQVATVLPGILVQAAYSRGFEQQADDDAAAALTRLGGNPAHMADLLERLDKSLCAKSACPPNWLGTHPDTGQRVLRLRNSPGVKTP